MSEPNREELKSIWKEISAHSKDDTERFKGIGEKLDKIIDRQSDIRNKVDVFLSSYQDLKVQVEGKDGEGGLKKKLNNSKERTGARLAPWPFLSLFFGFLNK